MEHDSAAEDRLKGNWKQIKGKIRETWGEMTDDELDQMQGRREQLVGYLQAKSGRERQEIEDNLDAWSGDGNRYG